MNKVSALSVLSNAVLIWNTTRVTEIVGALETTSRQKVPVEMLWALGVGIGRNAGRRWHALEQCLIGVAADPDVLRRRTRIRRTAAAAHSSAVAVAVAVGNIIRSQIHQLAAPCDTCCIEQRRQRLRVRHVTLPTRWCSHASSMSRLSFRNLNKGCRKLIPNGAPDIEAFRRQIHSGLGGEASGSSHRYSPSMQSSSH